MGGSVRIDGQLVVAAARCWSILRRYYVGERTDRARALMCAEIDTLVGWLMELNLPPGAAKREILAPIEAYLLARYGHEAGMRLNAEFVEGFEANGMCLLAAHLDPHRADRARFGGY